jgi:hypothetical protein
VRLELPLSRLIQALEESLSIGRRAKQVGSLGERVVINPRHQNRIAPLRGDLNGLTIVVHLLNEGEEVLSRLACCESHFAS